MSRHLPPSLLSSLLVLIVATGAASGADLAVGLRAGTTGLGPELVAGLSPRVHARLVGGAYSHDTTIDETGITYDATAELRSALLLLDWHPAAGGFRLSAGGGWNGTGLDVSAPIEDLVRRYRPDLPLPIPVLPLDLGTVHGRAEGDTFVPYAGLGWGRPFAGGRVGASLDLGVLYHGEPEVELTTDLRVSLPFAGARQVLAALAEQEEARLEQELRDYRYLPVAALGVTFSF